MCTTQCSVSDWCILNTTCVLLLFPVWWMNHKQLYYSYVAVLVLWYLCVKEQPEFIIPWSRVGVYSAESPAGGSVITLMAVALPLSAVCRLIPGQGFEKASLSPVVILASVNAWKTQFLCHLWLSVLSQCSPNSVSPPLRRAEPVFLSLIVVLDSVLLWGCILSDHCLWCNRVQMLLLWCRCVFLLVSLGLRF